MKIVKEFDTEVAKKVGTDAAIILSNIEFWQANNELNQRNFKNGRYWTYNSVKAFSRHFEYLTLKQIRLCLDKLEKSTLIISGNFNDKDYDLTKWYSSIREDFERDLTLAQKGNTPLPEKAIPLAQKGNAIPLINNTDINSKEAPALFSESEIQTRDKSESKILFENSIYNSYETFKSYLLKNSEFKERYRGANLKFYIEAVLKWSDKSGRKTTNRGWCAYLRDFMDRDIKDSKLEKLEIAKTKQEISLKEAAKQGVHFNH